LSPSTTEAVFALGQGARLIGRSQHCDFPREALRLPSVGGYADPDVERILALAPGLVVGERGPAGPALEQRLAARAIATFFPPTGTVAEVGDMLVALGARLGVPDEGARVRDSMMQKIERVSRWARAKKPVTVVMVFDAKPLFVAGPGGFPDELVRLAGATNAVSGGGAYPTIDIERLLALNPDVLVDATELHGGPSRLPELEGWSRLDAVRNGRVRTFSSATAMRPGPRLAEGLAEVVRVVHGEAPPSELVRE
jgi:iron complex transport system substrate-binding protein